MKNLKGKNALLTGGSMGIGLNIARVLAREGVNIALSARSEDKLTAVAHGLKEHNVRAIAVPADVTDSKSREKFQTQGCLPSTTKKHLKLLGRVNLKMCIKLSLNV